VFVQRISIFGKTPARSLGVVTAPDEATACTRAVEFFQIEPALQFRVMAVKVAEPKKAKVKS
jgi:hypothetical protein